MYCICFFLASKTSWSALYLDVTQNLFQLHGPLGLMKWHQIVSGWAGQSQEKTCSFINLPGDPSEKETLKRSEILRSVYSKTFGKQSEVYKYGRHWGSKFKSIVIIINYQQSSGSIWMSCQWCSDSLSSPWSAAWCKDKMPQSSRFQYLWPSPEHDIQEILSARI